MSDSIKGIGGLNSKLMEAQAAKFDQKLNSLKRLNNSTLENAKVSNDAQIEKAAVDFEAMLLNQMLKSMWTTVPKDGMLSGSNEETYYRDMLNQALAESIATDQSIGVKDVIMGELHTRQGKESKK